MPQGSRTLHLPDYGSGVLSRYTIRPVRRIWEVRSKDADAATEPHWAGPEAIQAIHMYDDMRWIRTEALLPFVTE